MPNANVDISNLKFRRFKPTEARTASQLLDKTLTTDEKKRGFFRVYVKKDGSEKKRELWVRVYEGGLSSVIVYVHNGGSEDNPKNWGVEYKRITRTNTQFWNAVVTATDRYRVVSDAFQTMANPANPDAMRKSAEGTL